MPVTTIFLIRHGRADWPGEGERPLSASGVRAAQAISQLPYLRPMDAIYSSPFRRSIETVTPLARNLGIDVEVLNDLRERELPVVAGTEFEAIVNDAWRFPERSPAGGESNVVAQARGLAVVRTLLGRHTGHHIAIATHGNLLALILNGVDSSYGYDFWRQLTFPDIYQLDFEDARLVSIGRVWSEAP
jgi:2,3-bisphosphoglycerate-dependent phosphoglycerate mutase